MISLADPTTNYAGVAPGPATCVNGKAIMCYACYTYTPVFLSIVGVTTVGFNAASGGGLPQVDAVLVFDFSGSMDDATKVQFHQKDLGFDYPLIPCPLSPTKLQFDMKLVPGVGALAYPGVATPTVNEGAIHYIEITPGNSSHQPIRHVLQHNYTNNPNGLNLNVLPPMNIDLADNPDCRPDQSSLQMGSEAQK